MNQEKLTKLSHATSIAGIVNGSIYILLSVAWALFMIKEIFFIPTVMGIMILAYPLAIAFAVFGVFTLRAGIILLKASKTKDVLKVRTLLQKNLPFAIILVVAGIWSIWIPVLMLVTAPAAIVYLTLGLLGISETKKVSRTDSDSKPVQ
jgi:hypothetical protein